MVALVTDTAPAPLTTALEPKVEAPVRLSVSPEATVTAAAPSLNEPA